MAIIILPADEALKTKSVKQLPQSRQVPTIYNKQFQHTAIIDTNLVILALRTDVATIYSLLEEVVTQVNANTIAIAANTAQLVTNTAAIADHETRIDTLENP